MNQKISNFEKPTRKNIGRLLLFSLFYTATAFADPVEFGSRNKKNEAPSQASVPISPYTNLESSSPNSAAPGISPTSITRDIGAGAGASSVAVPPASSSSLLNSPASSTLTGLSASNSTSSPASTPTFNLPPSSQAIEPPPIQGVEWLKVPYDKAENEVLALFQRDLPKLEETTRTVAIYEVRTSGQLPQNYHRNFRTKLERVFLTSKIIKIKQCLTCEESRLVKAENGELRYEAFSSDRDRPAKIALEAGADHLVYSDLIYTPDDLQLRVRLVQPSNGQILWSKEYSTADVVKTRESFLDSDPDELSHRDSLSRVIIGEIAFTTVMSTGVGLLPTIDQGTGTQLSPAPTLDLCIGEKFDRGRKFFGFMFGGSFNLVKGSQNQQGSPLPWSMRIGPRFGYVFNPYNMSSARWALITEFGGLLSTGLTTGFIGIGPEVKMIQRFSVGLMPIYILSANVAGSDNSVQNPDGSFTNSTSNTGKFGGLAFLMKASIHW